MRQILETEEHVVIPPMMYSDPFYRITYLIKEEIRKYKWIEGEKVGHFLGRRRGPNGPKHIGNSTKSSSSRPYHFLIWLPERTRRRQRTRLEGRTRRKTLLELA